MPDVGWCRSPLLELLPVMWEQMIAKWSAAGYAEWAADFDKAWKGRSCSYVQCNTQHEVPGGSAASNNHIERSNREEKESMGHQKSSLVKYLFDALPEYIIHQSKRDLEFAEFLHKDVHNGDWYHHILQVC